LDDIECANNSFINLLATFLAGDVVAVVSDAISPISSNKVSLFTNTGFFYIKQEN